MLARYTVVLLSAAGLALAQPGQPAPAQPSAMRDPDAKPAPLPAGLVGVGIDQKLNAQVPLDLTFRDEFGQTVPLSRYFHGKARDSGAGLLPLPHAVHADPERPGEQPESRFPEPRPGFRSGSVSFDPKDTPETAAGKKQTVSAALRPSGHRQRLAFPDRRRAQHPGAHRRGRASTTATIPKTDQFAHASGIMIATPEGPAVALFLRRGIRAARCPPGPGGGSAEQDRLRRWTRSCSSAITTTRPPASTAPSP